ncbi:centrosomal protein of 104 kDa isoform X3 [Patella vulgata]|uniref:centrosomal protein of 104 kDa isoform X3 n=1 Tax=Patella vulgata TaxID=6465 RepID=UPI0021807E0F|nr:centrosomal protein of 104 kDa isoform X3 [Patella vulgata]
MPYKLPFRVVHVSGQDENFKASELNTHGPLTKGWQSSRFCLYPQDIVIQLNFRSRLRKIQILAHQYLISTKIEFFVGDVPDGTKPSLENARYTRLGYVSLSDNEKTGYKARELKSVHVDAHGVFLKLNIHKNHINKYNLYNQVGLIAVNVIGDNIEPKKLDIMDPDFLDLSDKRMEIMKDPIVDGYINNSNSYTDSQPLRPDFVFLPDYISPLDDLAFDMYQDPEIAQIIRKLERKKQEAVLQERYDYAKRLKTAIGELQKVGEKLGKMEVEKRQAVENEDYDKAKIKKIQMDELRLQSYKDLHVNDLLELNGPRHPVHIDLEPVRHPTPPRLNDDIYTSHVSPPPTPPRYEDRPLPSLINPILYEEVVEEYVETVPDEEFEDTIGEAEPMTEQDLRDASQPIEVFGEPLVSKAYSKTWSYREDALLAVYKKMSELPSSTPKDESKYMMKAAIFLVKRAIDDKVYAVFKAAIHLLRMILTEYVARFKIPKQDIVSACERTLPNLLHKAGDTAVRNRDDAKGFILETANFPDVKPTYVVPHELVKPFKMSIAPRIGQSHVEILESLYKDHGLNKSGLSVENMMPFCVEVLNHHSADVRDPAERIIKMLYRDVGAPVKDYLPPDDEKNRKNTLWRQLFEYFDKVDGKPSKEDLKRSQMDQEHEKQAEIEALQKQLQQLKDMQTGKAPVDENILKDAKNKKTVQSKDKKKADPKSKSKSKLPPRKPPTPDDDNKFDIDNVCIFCDERNPTFTEEGLDVHYWKNCPLLKRCYYCRQVVEIASYTDHLLEDCEKKDTFKKCPRCSEAVSKSDYDSHIAEKSCTPAKANSTHCPLCHINVSPGDDSWKNHLMSKDGCKENPRRLLLFSKHPPAQTQTKIPKKTTVTKPIENSVIGDELKRRAAVVDTVASSFTSLTKDVKYLEGDIKKLRQDGLEESKITRKVNVLMDKKTSKKFMKKKLVEAYRDLEDMVTDSQDFAETEPFKDAKRSLRQSKHLVHVV